MTERASVDSKDMSSDDDTFQHCALIGIWYRSCFNAFPAAHSTIAIRLVFCWSTYPLLQALLT